MSTVDEAFSAVQSLAPAEKIELISRLWDSIPTADLRPNDSDLAEVKRRWADYESGREKAIPWQEVWSEIEAEMSDGQG